MRNLKLSDSLKQKVERWLSGTGGRGRGVLLLSEFEASVMQDEKILELCCTTLSL